MLDENCLSSLLDDNIDRSSMFDNILFLKMLLSYSLWYDKGLSNLVHPMLLSSTMVRMEFV